MSAPDLQALHAVLSSTLVPFGDQFRAAEAQLTQLSQHPGFVTNLLALMLEPSVELGVRQAAAVSLKNKIVRSWSHNQASPISDADKVVFKQQIIPALVAVPPALADFLLVCVSAILSYDFQHAQWPEFVPNVISLLQDINDFPSISAGLLLLKQLCKFYRWNTLEKNKQLAPLMEQTFPLMLNIAELVLARLRTDPKEEYYAVTYEVLKIYKLASSRYLPPVFRDPTFLGLNLKHCSTILTLPWPESVLNTPPSERDGLLPVKCLKWVTTNILRTHNLYLTKSYAQMSENSAQYAPFRELCLRTSSPEITRLYLERLQRWSTGADSDWLSCRALYTIVSYLESMIEQKEIFTSLIEPQLEGLLGQVFYPLMGPTREDFEEFEDDPTEFVQRRVNFNDMMLTPGFAASEFIRNVVKKRKHTLNTVVHFLQQCAEREQTSVELDVNSRIALFNLVQALAPTFLSKGSPLYSQLEPFVALFVVPALSSTNPYLRYEACNTTTKLGSVKFQSRETVQQLFQGVLNCFFDNENLPVQVAAAQTLEALSLQAHSEDITSALGENITEVVRNLLVIMSKIDLEVLLAVLDHFVNNFPEQITPFATDLASQLTQQFLVLASDLVEAQRQSTEGGPDNRVVESEVMMANDEKISAGLGILTSLTNLQNNLEHQRDLTVKLDSSMAPVLLAVYQSQLTDFYPDCMVLHENTLFTMKFVPEHHWQLLDLLLNIVGQTGLEYFEEAMPILENYIVYGSSGFALYPQRLHGFVSLLIGLYQPPAPGVPVYDYGASAAYSEAKTRMEVMSIMAKLLVSSDLFNGPLVPLLPDIVNGILNRVGYDTQQANEKGDKQAFPPRYNVSTVSVILAAIYHEPDTTLGILQQTGAMDTFFETWLLTIKEFSRINDLKLALMAILSLLSYQTTHPQFKIPHFSEMLGALTHILEALPGAAARMAELMKRENENLWDDDELDDDEFDEQFDEEEEDAGAEFDREVGTVDPVGNGTFMYEQPQAPAGATTADVGDADEAAVADLRSALSAQMGFVTDDFDEDIYSASPLDNLNAYDALRSVVYGMRDNQKPAYDQLLLMLPEHGKVVLDESLQRESLPKYDF